MGMRLQRKRRSAGIFGMCVQALSPLTGESKPISLASETLRPLLFPAFQAQHGYLPLFSGKELKHSCCETNARNVNCFAIVHAPCMQLPRCRACTWVIFGLRPVKFYRCASTRRTRVFYATAKPLLLVTASGVHACSKKRKETIK